MNTKSLFFFLAMFLAAETCMAQNQEQPDSLTHELQEIVVKANQPATKLIGSSLVSTIPGTSLAELGNALDVLSQLPMITVQDNNVSVIGKDNIEIYIDGRPMRDNQELLQILSSNLKKVELMLAPGAMYDSTTGAVLKITTKRNFVQGLSFNDQLQLQQRNKFSVMELLGINYRIGNWDLFFNGVINRNNFSSKGTTTNSFFYDDKKTIIGSYQNNAYPTTTGVVKTGVNYNRGDLSLGAYYRYNPEKGNFTNFGSEWLDDNSAINRNIDKRIKAHNNLVSVYYENLFDDRYRLHFDGDFHQSVNNNNVNTTYPLTTSSTQFKEVASYDERKSTLWAAKLYLTCPLFNGDFSVGTQDSYTRSSLDYHMLNPVVGEYIPSSFTDARQTSASLFSSWSKIFGKLSVSLGARYEYVDYQLKVDEKLDEDISRKDHMITPDLALGYNFNDNSQINLSYKMATVKPPYSQLTGSLSYVGVHEIEGGNPALRDERMHDIQLFGMWKDLIIQTDYIHSLNSYAFVKQVYPADNLQLIMHPVNIDVSALSLYVVWSKSVHNWTPNITGGMYRQWLDIDNTHYNRPIFSYYFDNMFSLPYGWIITANMRGRTKGDMHTNRFGATAFTMDASVSKKLLNMQLTVKLTATDIFNTTNNDWTMNTYGIFVDKRQRYDSRGISLSLIYNFQPQKSKYKGNSAAESEMNRL